MRFDLDDSQKEIKRTAREFLARHASPERVRAVVESQAPDADLAAGIAGLGWTGICVEEEHGGLGLGSVGLAVLLEETGYALAGGPLLGTACAAFGLAAAGSEEQRRRWLPRFAEGSANGAFGIAHSGTAELVAEAERADVFVLVEDGAATLVERDAAAVEPLRTIDRTRGYGRVSGAGEPMPGDPAPALARAAIAVAAELVGVGQRALDVSVGYVKEREQFGRPIGSFQAVAHRCADMLVAVELARSAAYHGAWSADVDRELGFAAALAKATASDAATEATASAIQVHGGVGFTWETDVHLLYKRAQVDAQLLGGAGQHRLALIRELAGRRG